jgi:hypothetical protein
MQCDGLRRRYLNLIAEHLEENGACDLGKLGTIFPIPNELLSKSGCKMKDLLEEANDVFILVPLKDSEWSVRLRPNRGTKARIAPVFNAHNPRLEKTGLCLDFKLTGRCARGATCWFAHGTEQLKPRDRSQQPYQDQVLQKLPTTLIRTPAPASAPTFIGTFGALSLLEEEIEPDIFRTILSKSEGTKISMTDSRDALGTGTLHPNLANASTTSAQDLQHAAEMLRRYILESSGGCVFTYGNGPESIAAFYRSMRETYPNLATIIGNCAHDGADDGAHHGAHDGAHHGLEALVARHPHLLRCCIMDPTDMKCRITLQGGYQKPLWSDLTPLEQGAATRLGYNQHHWENGLTPTACACPWSKLAPVERRAACLLGYCDELWDMELQAQLQAPSASSVLMYAGAAPIEGAARQITTDQREHVEARSSASLHADCLPNLVEARSSASLHAESSHGSQLSCKAKADMIRKELGFADGMAMATVVQQGFELVGYEPPVGGLIKQVGALYTLLFE